MCNLLETKVQKEARYQCGQCENHPGLCPVQYFMNYHTKAIY